MNTLDLHILQNYPVSCLCRDENGSPKTMLFGGVTRSRISSQSLKRAIREYLIQIDKAHFGGIRMRSISADLAKVLVAKGIDQDIAIALATTVANLLGKSEKEKTKTILFFSAGEIEAIAQQIADAHKDNNLKSLFDIKGEKEAVKKAKGSKSSKAPKETVTEETAEDQDEAEDQDDTESLEDTEEEVISEKVKVTKAGVLFDGKVYKCKKSNLLKKATPVDIADIEMFGRMVAGDPSLFVEGAASFSHPFSVHPCENEIDFFSSVDETKDAEEQGAGHIGEIEYTSACYYKCISINLDLVNSGRLSFLDSKIRLDILKLVIEACIIAVPGARHNSMFAATLPSLVLGLVRKNTFPLSLANAFEKPIQPSSGGYTEGARKRLENEWQRTKETYGSRLGIKAEIWFPDVNLDTFLEGMLSNA